MSVLTFMVLSAVVGIYLALLKESKNHDLDW